MSSTNINRANLENISPFRRDSTNSVSMNHSQRVAGHTSHKKINSSSRGQLSHRCNSSSNTSNSNTFANSSLNLQYNVNTSLNQNNNNNAYAIMGSQANSNNTSHNNENILSSSLLRSSIASHTKQHSNGNGIPSSNLASSYSNLASRNANQFSASLSNSSYSKALTSIDICCDSSSKTIQNNQTNKLQQHQQLQQQYSINQLKQNAIKKYQLQQQLQQNVQQQPTNQIPPYHFEKGASKTHRGHTSSYNNFSYVQQQNSSVQNILGNSQKPNMNQNWNEATPPSKRVNTMPSQHISQQLIPQQQLNLTNQVNNLINDENAMLTLSQSINISTYKVSPKLLKSSTNTSQNSHQVINNFMQTIQPNSNNNNNNSINYSNQQQHQTSTSSNLCISNQSNTNTQQQQQSINLSIKRVQSQDEVINQMTDEEDLIYLEKLKKEIDGYKQREVQYLTRINSLEGDNKIINESVQKQETNIKNLKNELIKYQQQSINTANQSNLSGSQQLNSNQDSQQQQKQSNSNNNNNNVNIQLQQKQIAMLESYVETLSKKLQQLEMEQIRQQNANPQNHYEKQYQQQKVKYKQLVEKYFTLEKVFNQITSENDFYKITLNQLKQELSHQQNNQQDQTQSSVLKALKLAQTVKQL